MGWKENKTKMNEMEGGEENEGLKGNNQEARK